MTLCGPLQKKQREMTIVLRTERELIFRKFSSGIEQWRYMFSLSKF